MTQFILVWIIHKENILHDSILDSRLNNLDSFESTTHDVIVDLTQVRSSANVTCNEFISLLYEQVDCHEY